MKLTLSNGATYGIDNQGNRVCTGSQMGRRNILPLVKDIPLKLHLIKLPMCGDYDKWGAYWGCGSTERVYCAYAYVFPPLDMDFKVLVFVRATCRDMAKLELQDLFPNSKFYR